MVPAAWCQKTISLRAKSRGCHLVTEEVLRAIGPELRPYQVGLAHFFILHTSASLTINENYDPDVRRDMEDSLNRIVPERGVSYRHSMEGADDMPGMATLYALCSFSAVVQPMSRLPCLEQD